MKFFQLNFALLGDMIIQAENKEEAKEKLFAKSWEEWREACYIIEVQEVEEVDNDN